MDIAELQRDYSWESLLAAAFHDKVALALDPDCSNQPFVLENVTEILAMESFDQDELTAGAVFRLDDGRIAYVSGFFEGGSSDAVFARELSMLLDYLPPELRKALGW